MQGIVQEKILYQVKVQRNSLEHSNNLQTYQNDIFVIGDTVYYKRRDNKKWEGNVIVVSGQEILIKHGSTYIRCHPSLIKEYMKIGDRVAI